MNVTTDRNLATLLTGFGRVLTGDPQTLVGGEDNLNMRVPTDEGDVVVRRYLISPSQKVKAELELVDFLAKRCYPTPAPLPIEGGGFVVESRHPVAVFQFARGMVPTELTEDLAEQTGELLARLHTLTSDWTDDRIPRYDRPAMLRRSTEKPFGLAGDEIWRDEVTAFLADNQNQLDELAHLPAGPLHHDLHRQNLLVHDNQITAVLDFDEINHGPVSLDLARALFYLAVERHDRRLPGGLAHALITGYQHARTLTPAERELLPIAFDLVSLFDAAQFLSDNAEEPWLSHLEECHSWQVFRENAGTLTLPAT